MEIVNTDILIRDVAIMLLQQLIQLLEIKNSYLWGFCSLN